MKVQNKTKSSTALGVLLTDGGNEVYQTIYCSACLGPIGMDDSCCRDCGIKCLGQGIYPERHRVKSFLQYNAAREFPL